MGVVGEKGGREAVHQTLCSTRIVISEFSPSSLRLPSPYLCHLFPPLSYLPAHGSHPWQLVGLRRMRKGL